MKVSLRSTTRPATPLDQGLPVFAPAPRTVLGQAQGEIGPIVPSASVTFGPRGAAIDPRSGALVVADTGHHRLLVWSAIPTADHTPADLVLGQPDFQSEGRNAKAAPGSASFDVPTGVAMADGALVVADAWNHRILIWRVVPTRSNQPADVVLGQADFTSVSANRGGVPRADTLNWCYGVSWVDGRLIVADTGNRRVLVWNGLPDRNGTPADLVLGQDGFASRDENAGSAPGAVGMRWPHGIVVMDGMLLVSDAGNNRIMVWQSFPTQHGTPCDFVLGQASTGEVDHNRAGYWPDARCLNMPYGIAAVGEWLVGADTANSRLLAWAGAALAADAPAVALAGQPHFGAKGDNRWQTVARDSLCWPYGVTASGSTVVVADSGNNRVLLWDTAPPNEEGLEIRLRGIVQGVGFRPTVYRLANEEGIRGEVGNDGAGVLVRASGTPEQLQVFIQRIRAESPPLARLGAIEVRSAPMALGVGFRIVESQGGSSRTPVAPDAGICAACRAEIQSAFERRFRYPFVNCTHCGPRFSIVERVPYDRAHTTMAAFPLCAACAAEFSDPTDRRHHAQPIACHRCGPQARLARIDGRAFTFEQFSMLDDVDAAAGLILAGKVVAIKGIGGYQLACDATDAVAVARLRSAKGRFHKPFALMARDLGVVREYCEVSDREAELLQSPAAPIVLLGARGRVLPDEVAPGLTTLGFMLPHSPLHVLLFRRLGRPVVMTSGNFSDEPQIIDDAEAHRRLAPLAEYILTNNRRIANRIDDSVVRVIADAPRVFRRARGYAPAPVQLPPGFEGAPGVLAFGGQLKSTFCLSWDGQAVLSQHQGDLEHPATSDDFEGNLALYSQLFDHVPAALVSDRHPEYLSTKLAVAMSQSRHLPLIQVQHHHAHLASVLAEHGVPIDAPAVIGVVMDGLGWGDDGAIWGGEFLRADYATSRRVGTLKPVAMLGGTRAILEPWRNTYTHLLAQMGWARFELDYQPLELYRWLRDRRDPTLDAMVRTGTNSPLASSCGRLFDAVGAALGLARAEAGYEGHAAFLLEASVDVDALGEPEELVYPFAIPLLPSGLPYLEPLAMWQALLGDLILGTPIGVIAARFHRGLARGFQAMVTRLAGVEGQPFDTVVLAGGCFQNRVLFEETDRRLTQSGFRVLANRRVPANDGGLALGQVAVASARNLGRN